MIKLSDILNEVKKNNYKVYFDIDDTITNYSERLKSTTARETADNQEFWSSAKWLPGSENLLKFAQNNFANVEILSAVPVLSKADQASTGKRFRDAPIKGKLEWLNKNVGPIKVNWTGSGKEKSKYADKNTILIDDKLENIEAFEASGGIGILFTNAKKALKDLKKYT